MVNWTDIHKNFARKRNGKTYQRLWERIGITYQETKQLVEARFEPEDINYLEWLKSIKKVDVEWILKHKVDSQKLKGRYMLYGICKECKQLNSKYGWCQFCNLSINKTINEFIQENKELKWIPYDKFTNIKYLAEGGFGKVYTASLLGKEFENFHVNLGVKEVILKSLNNSQEMITDFLQEIASYKLFSNIVEQKSKASEGLENYQQIVRCHGISQDPITGNYLMIMDYIPNGNLRQYLKNCYDKLEFNNKIFQLLDISRGLNSIHWLGLVHQDFHSGNILNYGLCNYISDLGLCRPANEKDEGKIYGVLPYVAPEVLGGKPYTQASDVYSFSMIIWEMFSGLPPHYNVAHDTELILKIHDGLRPNLDDIQIPQLLKDLIKRCWDTDPGKRLSSSELLKTLSGWYKDIFSEISTAEFYKQYKEIKEAGGFNQSTSYPVYQIHPSAIYTSRLLDTESLKSLLRSRNSKKINNEYWGFQNLIINTSAEFSQSSQFYILQRSNDQELAERTKRQLSLETQTKTTQGESKLPKIDENQPYQAEPIEMDNNQNADWININPNFTNELIKQWQNNNFTYEQVQGWINAGFRSTDAGLAAFVRDNLGYNMETVLNNAKLGLEPLRKLYQEYLKKTQEQSSTQPQILHNPPKNN